MVRLLWSALLVGLLLTPGLCAADEAIPEPTGPGVNKPAWMASGTKLVYAVDYKGQQYDFEVTIEDMTSGLAFTWVMTDPANREGSVLLSPEALAGARAQENTFSGGDSLLTDATTVWLSEVVYQELALAGTTTIVLGGNDAVLERKAVESMRVLVMDQALDLDAIYAETTGATEKYWVLDNPYAPLILKMDLGWTIELKEITWGETREDRDRATFTPASTEPAGAQCLAAVAKAWTGSLMGFEMNQEDGTFEPFVEIGPYPDPDNPTESIYREQMAFMAGGAFNYRGFDVYECRGDALYWTQSSQDEDQPISIFDPPVLYYQLPMVPGTAWDHRGYIEIDGDREIIEVHLEYGEVEKIKVPAGKFKAIPVTTTATLMGDTVTEIRWYEVGRPDRLIKVEADLGDGQIAVIQRSKKSKKK